MTIRRSKSPAKRQRFAGPDKIGIARDACRHQSHSQIGTRAQHPPVESVLRTRPSARLPAIHRTLQIAAVGIPRSCGARSTSCRSGISATARTPRTASADARSGETVRSGYRRAHRANSARAQTAKQRPAARGQHCRGEGNGKFHGGMTLERRTCWNVGQAASVAQIPCCCIAVRLHPRYRALPAGTLVAAGQPDAMLVSVPHAAGS